MEMKARPFRCFSRLQKLLEDRGMAVTELHRRLVRQGVKVNLKTLYRLADPLTPIERLDMGVAGAVCRTLDSALELLVVFEEAVKATARLRRLTAARQRRLDVLLDKQAEDVLGKDEERELRDLVDEAERLTLSNARTLARARRASRS